jgi:hypothetical protein
MMMRAKTFVLGMGTQKSGTTWLHAYVSAAASADMGFTKEYKVWDGRSGSKAARLQLTPRVLFDRNGIRRVAFRRWPSLYFRYFSGLLHGGTTLTGDISPSYVRLTPTVVRDVVAGFAARGIRVKVVFLMRDPMERCWSAARMRARRSDPARGDQASVALLRKHFRHPHYQVRTRYEKVLANIEASGINAEDVHVALYEEMFSPREIERLSGFLGIPADPSFGERRVLSAPSQLRPPPELAREVAVFYRETYAAITDRFPQARFLWPGFRLLIEHDRQAAGGDGKSRAA